MQEKINQMILDENASINDIIEARLKMKSAKQIYDEILELNKKNNLNSEHTIHIPLFLFNKIFEKQL